MELPVDDLAEPSTSSFIKDGTISGLLPETEAFAVHYPGYPSSTARAIETLGGLPEIAKVRSSESASLELRFRPEEPFCHPASGVLRPSASLLLRITKTKSVTNSQDESLLAEVVARVNNAYHFEGMADYQHVVPVHAAAARRKKRPWASDAEPESENGGTLDMEQDEVMMLVPPLFSIKDRPEKLVLKPSPNLFSRSIQKGIMEHTWEMDIEPCLAISFDIERVPLKINWEDHISEGTSEWDWQTAVMKLFEERPIWPRQSLHERLLADGYQVSVNQMKRLLFRAGYYFSTGPFGKFWITKGYDPRNDPESRVYQRVDFRMPPQLRNFDDAKLKQSWKEIYQFETWPSKTFISLQLFELVDEFIQEEIRKPTKQTTCTVGSQSPLLEP